MGSLVVPIVAETALSHDRRPRRPQGWRLPSAHVAALHRELGLTDDEAADIEDILGRVPNHLELAMYAVMWSEHCSYKSLPHPPQAPADRGRSGARRPRRERRRPRRRATASPSPSASSPTTTRRPSSPTRARPPARAGSCATSSPWAPAPSPSWTRCASARWTTRGPAGSPRAWSRGSPATATRSACPRSAARSSSTRPTRATRWSTCSASGSCPRSGWCSARPSGEGNLAVLLGLVHRSGRHRRGQRAGLAPASARRPRRTSGPRSRSATPSRRSA